MDTFFIQDNMRSSYTSHILLSTASLGLHHGSGHNHRHPDQALDSCCPMWRRGSHWRKVQQEDRHLDTYKQLDHPDPTSGQHPQSGWIVDTPWVAAVFRGRERRSQTWPPVHYYSPPICCLTDSQTPRFLDSRPFRVSVLSLAWTASVGHCIGWLHIDKETTIKIAQSNGDL